MTRYIIRRLLWGVLLMFVVSALLFLMFRYLPTADPATSTADPAISPADSATEPATFRTRLITLPGTSMSPTSNSAEGALGSGWVARRLPVLPQLPAPASLRSTVCSTPPLVK